MKNENLKHKFNSVQLNIVAFVDVSKAVALNSLEGSVFMVDNSIQSIGQGTSSLQTTCKQGQVLNWLIYPMAGDRRVDGSWPPSVRINNIVFLGEDGKDVAITQICKDMKVYGPPDKIRPPQTPVYYYWAGTVPLKLPEGVFRYRLILELEDEINHKSIYLNLDSLSLNVISINAEV